MGASRVDVTPAGDEAVADAAMEAANFSFAHCTDTNGEDPGGGISEDVIFFIIVIGLRRADYEKRSKPSRAWSLFTLGAAREDRSVSDKTLDNGWNRNIVQIGTY